MNGLEVHSFSSLAFDPSGILWGSANGTVYTINPHTGALTQRWDFSTNHQSNTFDFRVNAGALELIGFVHRNENDTDAFVRWDVATATYIGGYDVTQSYASSAYDPQSQRYYAVGTSDLSLRYFYVVTGPPSGTLVGSLGLVANYNNGGAWFNGAYYHVYRQTSSGPLVFGRVNTTTGVFFPDFNFSQAVVPFADGLGYAVAREPVPVSGTVQLQNRAAGAIAGTQVTIEIRSPSSTTAIDSQVAVLDSAGNFSLVTAVPAGTYDVTAKASNWLRQKLAGCSIGALGITGLHYSLFNGDINGDNHVSLVDFAQLRTAFGSSSGNSNWNPNADLNGDGHVSLSDFAILRTNFGKQGDP